MFFREGTCSYGWILPLLVLTASKSVWFSFDGAYIGVSLAG